MFSFPHPIGARPRQRGGRRRHGAGGLDGRNIPATAGRTHPAAATTTSTSEHPHFGGEDQRTSTGCGQGIGPPPRRRGGHEHDGLAHVRGRNTPASAGRTSRSAASTLSAAEHSRVGGEYACASDSGCSSIGTLPRPPRSTPASAGRTRSARTRRSRTAEHPASGRTGCSTPTPPDATEHPRIGGEGGGDLEPGTPRAAGRTVRSPAASTTSTEHPRVGGEGERPGWNTTSASGTPQSAGRTASQAWAFGSAATHLRVGGEGPSHLGRMWFSSGTPPRRRVVQRRFLFGVAEPRNTSASAGRTPARPGSAPAWEVDRGEQPPRRRGGLARWTVLRHGLPKR